MSKRSKGSIGEHKVISFLSSSITQHHHLLNDITLSEGEDSFTHQIDHILIHPHGVFLIETKNYKGTVLYDEDESGWYIKSKSKTIRISSPLRQNKGHLKALKKILGKDIPIIPVVTFSSNNAPYAGDENVINLDDLVLFIESCPYQRLLPNDEIDMLASVIEDHQSDIPLREHIDNIKIIKTIRKESQAEITYALEQGHCPRCNGKMINVGYRYHCSRCRFGFTL